MMNKKMMMSKKEMMMEKGISDSVKVKAKVVGGKKKKKTMKRMGMTNKMMMA